LIKYTKLTLIIRQHRCEYDILYNNKPLLWFCIKYTPTNGGISYFHEMKMDMGDLLTRSLAAAACAVHGGLKPPGTGTHRDRDRGSGFTFLLGTDSGLS
jgi:hypothetical protein